MEKTPRETAYLFRAGDAYRQNRNARVLGDKGSARKCRPELRCLTSPAFRKHDDGNTFFQPVLGLSDGFRIGAAPHWESAEVLHPEARPLVLPELFFSHENAFKGEAGGDDRGISDVQVVGDD
jgi:hypothetical protein